ncbi:hypothetical protein LEP1GSC170_0617 [Leptospira interrogans serovar Bataviae str. HAI135]|nr:hypothetical protein LEP1GSC170_0617 [Leptospira interrogans serovar Bataviae str. HAI135]
MAPKVKSLENSCFYLVFRISILFTTVLQLKLIIRVVEEFHSAGLTKLLQLTVSIKQTENSFFNNSIYQKSDLQELLSKK